jgi:hypothetical protein
VLTCIACLDVNETGLPRLGMTEIEKQNFFKRQINAKIPNSRKKSYLYVNYLRAKYENGEITLAEFNRAKSEYKKAKKRKRYLLLGRITSKTMKVKYSTKC